MNLVFAKGNMSAFDNAEAISLAIRDRPLSQILAMGDRLDRGERLALYWADMRSRWRSGQQVTAEDYLSSDRHEDEEYIVDLIYAEYVLREEYNAPLDLETYGLRFPDQFAALQRQIPIHEGLRELGLPSTDTLSADNTAKPDELQRIGKYLIVAKIGSGGQCDVYRAVHADLGREVAIKIGRPTAGSDPVLMETLHREGQILSELRHPHLARVFDLDVHEGRPFLVLEYVRGQNLFQYASQHPFQPLAAAQTIASVARALSVVHHAGLVHGDCKPNNIVIDPHNQPQLIDFGLAWRCDAWSGNDAKATAAISGTLAFMSPEQVAGNATSIDHRSDVFNLGGTLYFLLTGKVPYRSSDLQEALRMVRRCQWDRDALQAAKAPLALKRICRRAMASAPEQRYASIDQMADDLDRVVSPLSLRRLLRPKTPWILGGLAAMLVAVLVWNGWHKQPPLVPQSPSNSIASPEAAPLD